MLLGQMKHIQGTAFINGKRAVSFDRSFIRKATILENIVFEDESDKIPNPQYREKVKQAEALFK